jgi:Tol biopolymer transport system component
VTRLVSLASDGSQGTRDSMSSGMSANGRYVAFVSWASNLVPGDLNRESDLFVRDVLRGRTTRVSILPGGRQMVRDEGVIERSYGGDISADGRYVVFDVEASGIRAPHVGGVYVRDRARGVTSRVGGDGSYLGRISGDGRYVVFASANDDLVRDDGNEVADVFLRDRRRGTTVRVSVATDGSEAGDESAFPATISADGQHVVFRSSAHDLVPGDTNHMPDVFVRDGVGTP